MVSVSLIAAIMRESKRHEAEDARMANTDREDFTRRFSALYGQGAHKGDDPAVQAENTPAEKATAPHDPTVWEDGEMPPERLPDVPTVPNDPRDTSLDAQERPYTGAERVDQPTTPPEAENAPTGRLLADSGRGNGKKRAKRASNGRKRARKG